MPQGAYSCVTSCPASGLPLARFIRTKNTMDATAAAAVSTPSSSLMCPGFRVSMRRSSSTVMTLSAMVSNSISISLSSFDGRGQRTWPSP